MTTLTLHDFSQDESVAAARAASLAKLIHDEPKAPEAVFGTQEPKWVIDPVTGDWGRRPHERWTESGQLRDRPIFDFHTINGDFA